ncbi:hypothetical protein PC129_g20228 [Phytophthora cactorum]|uniref:Uncharacterized protein n=1 Tax=Phytophthora cactorum TaxID=29920 RepID=A0A329RWM8_9STRA|nr:hypothetical protein Pcac1_g11149 [Phytophthora cactorum]KAG2808503.1 hypothetical protein PC112_g16938 [Phytophthora cactorum]KAG2855804.1 hypothetical protein PC113_g12137 [Phytophthora cactorum]KAG2886259.1 hypothetical protein PC115_g20723 [Phytophthora cactorum]KAG2896287.1 hypothetical protein PC117_g23038 [Phytophthora cactorum]
MGWQGRSWVYYKSMMEIAFEEKCVLPCVTGDATLASNAEDTRDDEGDGTDMWEYLEELYEGKQNDATRTNQKIILFNKLQPAKGKPNWDVAQPVDNIFMTKPQL